MINEHQRQLYLNSLGIEAYVPRWIFPNAPQPGPCETRFQAEENVTSDTNPAIQTTPHPRASLLKDDLSTVRSSAAEALKELVEKKAVTASPLVLVAPSTPAIMKAEPFSLTIWRLAGQYLIIDSRNTRQALPTNLLIHRIVNILLKREISLGDEEVFRWPITDTENMSAIDARDTLHAWLEVEIEQRPVKRVLLFGESAAQYMLPADKLYPQCLWQWQELPIRNIQSLVAPSLVELLQQPLLKRQLWQCLSRLLQVDD